jgi:hypothetical protein
MDLNSLLSDTNPLDNAFTLEDDEFKKEAERVGQEILNFDMFTADVMNEVQIQSSSSEEEKMDDIARPVNK